jgi:hypothetical protein
MLVKRKLLACFLGLVILSSLPSCSWLKDKNSMVSNPDDYKIQAELKEIDDTVSTARAQIDEGVAIIDESTDGIREGVSAIEGNVPTEVRETIDPHIGDIRKDVEQIEKESANIAAASGRLAAVKEQISTASEKSAKLETSASDAVIAMRQAQKERDEALARENDATKRMVRWIIVLCIAGAGASIAIMVFASKQIGVPLLVGSVATLVLAVSVNKYFDQIAMVGAAFLGISLLAGGYYLFVQKKAVKETVHTTEIVKKRLKPDDRRAIFGYEAEPGLVKSVQSASTEKLVANARKGMSKEWEHSVTEASGVMDKHEEEVKAKEETSIG